MPFVASQNKFCFQGIWRGRSRTMNYCFPCLQSQKSKKTNRHHGESAVHSFNESKAPETKKQKPTSAQENKNSETTLVDSKNINSQAFTFRELATATKNFRQECLLGEGGFGRVYKGTLQSTGQVVAVKQLDRNGLHGSKEFLVEVMMLSLLHHPNLVNLIGYCADGDQRLMVYDFLPGGCVEDHLLDVTEEKKPLDWITRIKIALGTAQGLEYLHDKANPPIIYHDLKASNILLDENLVPKLSDFGLSKLGHFGDKMRLSSRVMGTYGYCAPEYARTGQFTIKSDVYSFGVVLLELITGRRVIDNTRPVDEQNLIAWAQPIFREPKRFPDMADPLLKKQFPERSINQAVAIAAMCLQEEPSTRPLMSDVVTTLSFLTMDTENMSNPPAPIPSSLETSANVGENDKQETSDQEGGYTGTDEDKNNSDYEDEERKQYQDNQKEENINEVSKEENLTSSRESTKSGSKSRRKNGSRRSMDRCSSRSSNGKSLQDGSAALSNGSSWESNDGSIISSERSSKGSGDFGISSQRSSVKLQNSSTQMSRKGDESDYLSDRKRISNSTSLAKQKSSRKSQDGNVSSGHRRSIKKSTYGSSQNSSLYNLTDESVSSQNSFRKSIDETSTATSQAASEDPRNEVIFLDP